MANQVPARNQRSYPLIESTYGVAPVTSPANGDCCLIASLVTKLSNPEIKRTDKTGSMGSIIGIGGRRSGTWSASVNMAGNGAAGVKPDCDEYLQLALGKAAVVSAGVSVTYGLDDATCPSGSIYNYNAPGTATQQVSLGSICTEMKETLVADIPSLEFSGESMWVYDSDQAADATNPPDATAKGGLTSFPAEPAAPVSNGVPPNGAQTTVTIDGNSYSTCRSVVITHRFARETSKDCNTLYPVAPTPGPRTHMLDFSLVDDDSAALRSLKQKAISKTPINITFVTGNKAGNTWTRTLKNVILPAPDFSDAGQKRVVGFSGAEAHDSSIGSKDAYSLVIS